MTVATWFALAAVCVLGAMSPGPSLAVVAHNTIAGSRIHGIATALAHAGGVGLYALLTSFGLAVLVTGSPVLFQTLTLGGAGYLLWLGVGAVRAGGAPVFDAGAARPGGVARAARDGFAMSLLNPKIAVFFLALFSQFAHPGMSAAGHGVMWATATTVDGAWYVLVALTLSRAGMLAWLRRRARWIDRAAGTVLIALALATLVQLLI